MPTDADVIAFIAMLSGMAMAAGFVVFIVLCFTSGGPAGAVFTITVWVIRRARKDPFPAGTLAYWVSTTELGAKWTVARSLFGAGWGLMVGVGFVLSVYEMFVGPKEQRIFVDQFGVPRREVTRMKEKRVMPERMEKAVKAVTPARDRLAFELDARRRARNEGRAQVGLAALPDSWVRRKLTAALPTGKVKLPPPPKGAKKQARKAARAEVAALRLPPPPPGYRVNLDKTPARPRAGHDPAAPPAAPGVPRPFGRA